MSQSEQGLWADGGMRIGIRIVALIGVEILTSACGGGDDDAVRASQSQDVIKASNVAVVTIRPDTLTQISRYPASVEAWRDVQLSFLESGPVSKVLVDLGDIVDRGQVLATLHTSLLDAALIEAEAGAKFQRYNHRKSKQLFADGTISERDLFQAEYDFKRAESNLTTVTQRLTNSKLQAPFSGMIAGREIEVGRLVGPSQPAIHLIQWDKVKMRAWISESEVADFVPGRKVDAHIDAVPDKVFIGSVGRVGPSADAKRRVFPIEVHIDNENGDLRPGMVGKLTIRRRTFENVVVIPREAVVERETGPGAFVVDGDSVAYRPLELGTRQGNRVIALSGLKSGERVVVSGGRDLIDGERVLVKETRE